MRLDSAIFEQSDGKNMVFFVLSEKIEQIDTPLPISYLGGLKRSITKLGDTLPVTPTVVPTPQAPTGPPSSLKITDGGFMFLNESAYDSTYQAYQLDLSDNINKLQGANNQLVFPNKVYGTLAGSDHPKFIKYWLAYIGYIMSIVILLLHFVFIGNELLYKVDNLLIFVQSVFYFSFAKNLVGRLVAQFYYGWFFSHAGFLPNLFSSVIPDYYAELAAPESYKLVNIDGNYFRNAGFSLAWVLIYLACCLVAVVFIWVLFKACKKK